MEVSPAPRRFAVLSRGWPVTQSHGRAEVSQSGEAGVVIHPSSQPHTKTDRRRGCWSTRWSRGKVSAGHPSTLRRRYKSADSAGRRGANGLIDTPTSLTATKIYDGGKGQFRSCEVCGQADAGITATDGLAAGRPKPYDKLQEYRGRLVNICAFAFHLMTFQSINKIHKLKTSRSRSWYTHSPQSQTSTSPPFPLCRDPLSFSQDSFESTI